MVYREATARGVTRLTGSALAAYPVGAVYQSLDPTDPGTLFGGTWLRIKGRMLVGVDEVDPDFASAGLAGGEKEHILTRAEMAEHVHNPGNLTTTSTGSAHTHGAGSLVASKRSGAGSAAGAATGNTTLNGSINITGDTDTAGSGHTHVVSGDTGGIDGSSDDPHENMPPWYSIYMWRRTA